MTRLRLREAARRAGVALDEALGVEPSERPAHLADVRAALTTDAASILTRLRATFEALGGDRVPDPTGFMRFDGDLTPFAYARPSRTSRVELAVSAGMILSIEDLLLKCLCQVDFFSFDELFDPADNERTLAPIKFFRVSGDDDLRYGDYSWLSSIAQDVGFGLTANTPYSPWRLRQFELLRELSVQWLYLHEAAHWLLGHIDFCKRNQPARREEGDFGFHDRPNAGAQTQDLLARALKAAAAEDLDAHLVRRCFESQADQLAFEMLARLNQAETPEAHGAFARYAEAMSALALPEPFDNLIALSPERKIRAMLVAAQLVIALIELEAQSQTRSGDYPLPRSRSYLLQIASASLWPIANTEADGAYIDGSRADEPDVEAFLREAFARPILDVNRIHEALGLPPPVSLSQYQYVEEVTQLLNADSVASEGYSQAASELKESLDKVHRRVAVLLERYRPTI